jgi:quercetin dioxygenase-like cupin family protein
LRFFESFIQSILTSNATVVNPYCEAGGFYGVERACGLTGSDDWMVWVAQDFVSISHDGLRPLSAKDWEARLVRYIDLRPCYNAFIDCRSPGSEAKENFTIIGPGVSENPDQYVHIAEPHGFNIGGARQPPACVNSQHSHDTAEVFLVHTGHWRFDLGETGQDAQVEMGPGDVISIPTGMFRGFTNIGSDIGFLWAVLGEDDPGRVLWAPDVFKLARKHGLILLETGQLIDTVAGQTVPAGAAIMPETTAKQVASLHVATQAEAESFVAKARPGTFPIIDRNGVLRGEHGFSLSQVLLKEGQRLEEVAGTVIFVHKGALTLTCENGPVLLQIGDTLSVPHQHEPMIIANQDSVIHVVKKV